MDPRPVEDACPAAHELGPASRISCYRPLGHVGLHFDMVWGWWWGEGEPPEDAWWKG